MTACFTHAAPSTAAAVAGSSSRSGKYDEDIVDDHNHQVLIAPVDDDIDDEDDDRDDDRPWRNPVVPLANSDKVGIMSAQPMRL